MRHLFFLLLFLVIAPTKAAIRKAPSVPAKTYKITKKYGQPINFSGAKLWAHRQGLTGKTIPILIVDYGRLSKTFKKELGSKLHVYAPADKNKVSTHGEHVTRIIKDISPQSIYYYMDKYFFNKDGIIILGKKSQSILDAILYDPEIVNISYGLSKVKIQIVASHQQLMSLYKKYSQIQWILEKFVIMDEFPKLAVIAAGNEGQNLSLPIPLPKLSLKESIHSPEYHLAKKEELLPHLIFTGALSQRGERAEWSNIPGFFYGLQNNFIFTIGEHIRLKNGTETTFEPGTSFSAPTVSGALALLMEKFPNFSIFNIKEVLLESARRTFVISGLKDKRGRYSATFVVDPDDYKGNMEPTSLNFPPDKYVIRKQIFDKNVYGKGILDLRAAFIYGDLKTLNTKWPAKKLREKMNQILELQESQAARKIQRAFRAHRNKKVSRKALGALGNT